MNKIFDMAIPSRWQDKLVFRHDLVLASSSVKLAYLQILLWFHQDI